MAQFRHFGSVFVEEDRETGKAVQKPCLFTRQSRSSVQLDSRSVCDFVARDKVEQSSDKIARVTSLLDN